MHAGPAARRAARYRGTWGSVWVQRLGLSDAGRMVRAKIREGRGSRSLPAARSARRCRRRSRRRRSRRRSRRCSCGLAIHTHVLSGEGGGEGRGDVGRARPATAHRQVEYECEGRIKGCLRRGTRRRRPPAVRAGGPGEDLLGGGAVDGHCGGSAGRGAACWQAETGGDSPRDGFTSPTAPWPTPCHPSSSSALTHDRVLGPIHRKVVERSGVGLAGSRAGRDHIADLVARVCGGGGMARGGRQAGVGAWGCGWLEGAGRHGAALASRGGTAGPSGAHTSRQSARPAWRSAPR